MTRLQRRREQGWRMPANAVYVGRPTKWGNPFPVGRRFTRDQAVAAYRSYIQKAIQFDPEKYNLDELRGKTLVCWCPLDEACHADVLMELVNATARRSTKPHGSVGSKADSHPRL